MRRKRLLWQLYPSYLLITLAALLAITLYASGALRRFHLDQTKADLESRARLIQDEVRRHLAAEELDDVDRLCKERGTTSATRITVVLPSGKVVGDSYEAPEAMDNHADRPEILEALAGGTGSSERFSHTRTHEMAYVAVPVEDEGRIIGVLRTAIPLTSVNEALAAIYLRIAAGGLIVALLTAAVSMWVSRRISRPLEEIKRGAARFAQGDLTHKLPTADCQEIAAVAETINQMAAELDQRIRAAVGERNEREAVLSSMVEGVLAVDSRQHVLSVNQAAARMFGVDAKEAPGRHLTEVVRNPELHRLVADVLSERKFVSGQIVLYQEKERFLLVQGTVLRGADARPIGALVVLHDVTAIKRLEEIRRDFVANVSHELKTPITSIKGYVETLLDGAVDRPEDAQRFLRVVAAQADRLSAIVDDLLALSEIEKEAEEAPVELRRGPIKPVLQSAIEASGPQAARQEVRLELACDDRLEARINAPLLEQAVVNLVDNACKYSARGGTVRIEAARDEKEIVIQVRDHGCGIERRHLARIFERFYRADKARSREHGGTGLGLAIVKHIALAHGGQATVESTSGQGSTFSIRLPGN
jgi:two-component system phosphate regulon sensor histidine kinase PhoR